MLNWKMLLCGGAGGVFIPLFSAAQSLQGPTHSLIGAGDVGYIAWAIGAAIMFGLGAILAVITGETLAYKAFVIGISLPATINGYNENNTANLLFQKQGETEVQGEGPLKSGFLFGPFISPAMAEGETQTFTISGLGDGNGYSLVFYGAGGQLGKPVPVSSGPSEAQPLPQGATSVALRGPKGWSLPTQIDGPSRSGVVKLRAHVRSDFRRGFSRSFGGSSAPYEIEAR